MKEIAILGSTGSIGMQTMDVLRLYPDLFHASVIAAKKILMHCCVKQRSFILIRLW